MITNNILFDLLKAKGFDVVNLDLNVIKNQFNKVYDDDNSDDRALLALLNKHINIVNFINENMPNGTHRIHATNKEIFHWAVKNGHLNVVMYLQEIDINDDIDTDWALLLAIDNNQLEIVQFLIMCIGSDSLIHTRDNYILRRAVEKGSLDIVKVFMNNISQYNILFILQCAAEYGQLNVVKYLIEESFIGADNIALYTAVRNNQFEAVKYLHEKGADISKTRGYLTNYENTEMIDYLIENGAKDLNDGLVREENGTYRYAPPRWDPLTCTQE